MAEKWYTLRVGIQTEDDSDFAPTDENGAVITPPDKAIVSALRDQMFKTPFEADTTTGHAVSCVVFAMHETS